MNISSPDINYFQNPTISTGVFYCLFDRDLKKLGQTSKKMDEIAKKVIESRDERFKELLAPYLISREFNMLNSKMPSVFLVGDWHGNQNSMKALCKLVGHLSRRAPVFFVAEGIPSMEQCEVDHFFGPNFIYVGGGKPTHRLESFPDEEIFKENIYGLGWDAQKRHENGNPLIWEMNDIWTQRMRLKQGLVMKALEMCPLLPEELRAPGLWKRLGVTEELLTSYFKEGKNDQLNKLYHQFNALFLGQLSTHIESNFNEIKFNHQKLFQDYFDYRHLYDSVMSQDLELNAKLSEVRVQLISEANSQIDSRTTSMVSTLRQIDSYRLSMNIQDYFAVFCAGTVHLEHTADIREFAPDLSLLYKELENHKAQILIPLCVFQGKIIPQESFNKILHPFLRELASCMEKGLDSSSDEVQKIIKRHHIYIEEFYGETSSTKKVYSSMAETIEKNPVMQRTFDRFHLHLTTFMAEAMRVFAERALK